MHRTLCFAYVPSSLRLTSNSILRGIGLPLIPRSRISFLNHPGSGKWCIVLPKEEQQQAVMDEIHHYAEGHLGRDRMSNLLTSKYYWQGQSRDIQLYCQKCEHCRRFKNGRYAKYHGLMSKWETPLAPALSYSMDLITDLPPAG
jgi:hypothetical protein